MNQPNDESVFTFLLKFLSISCLLFCIVPWSRRVFKFLFLVLTTIINLILFVIPD